MGKRDTVVSTKVDVEARTVAFNVKGCAPIVVAWDRLSEGNRLYAALHGIKQRVGDAGALERNKVTGLPATPEDKHAELLKIAEHLNSGAEAWELAREGAGPGLDILAVRAVAEAVGKTEERVRQMVEAGAQAAGITQRAYLNSLATSEMVAPILNRMRAEATKVDPMAALAAMMAAGDEEEDAGDDADAKTE